MIQLGLILRLKVIPTAIGFLLMVSCSSPTDPDTESGPGVDFFVLLESGTSATVAWSLPGSISETIGLTYDLRFSTEAMAGSEDWDRATRVTVEEPANVNGLKIFTIQGLEPDRPYYAAMNVKSLSSLSSEFTRQVKFQTTDTNRQLDFSAPDIHGDTYSSLEWRGTDLVLANFWGVWCYYCRIEMPDLKRIHEDFVGDSIRIVGFNYGDDPQTALEYATEEELPWLNVVVSRDVVRDYKVSAFPTTCFMDSTGRMLGRVRGTTSYDEFAAVIGFLLGRTNSDLTPLVSNEQVKEP